MKHNLLYKLLALVLLCGCDDYYKNDYHDNTPTSGKLKVRCTEGLKLHIINQAYTFCSQYDKADIEVLAVNENEAIRDLLNDSCKAIVINRLLDENEKQLFAQKSYSPAYSPIARTGVALITNARSPLKFLNVTQVKQLLSQGLTVKDSLKNEVSLKAVIDNKDSDVSHYLLDSLLRAPAFGPNCFATVNTPALIRQIMDNSGQVGFIDFAWLSDRDDSLFKAVKDKIRFVAVGKTDTLYVEPNQSSFKTGQYPFIRTVYLLRRNEDFSLAKGFESFMAGPKGQLTFLKQGLMPVRQSERSIEVKFGQ